MNPSPTPIWSPEPPPRLQASRDTRSGGLRFPAFAPASPLATRQEQVLLASTGRVYSFTTVHPNPKSGEAAFALGYVDLPGPVRIFGRIRGEGVHIGASCQALPDAQYGYVFHTVTA